MPQILARLATLVGLLVGSTLWASPSRPQHPVGPRPYASREVVIESAGDTAQLAGTLTIPDPARFGAGPHPGIMLATGSGPQDRDETILGHKPFLVLADWLTDRYGFVVLRTDDRGVGGSSDPKSGASTTDDFARDTQAALTFLSQQPEVDAARVGVLGHSEGGIIAAIVGADAVAAVRPSFIVLLAGTGVPGADVMVNQLHATLKASGVNESDLALCGRSQRKMFAWALSGTTLDPETESAIRDLVRVQFQSAGLTPNETGLKQGVALAKQQMDSQWMRRFLALDPREFLRKVSVPVLVLNGSKDTQVTPALNVPAITQALMEAGNPDVSIHVLPDLNHMFQTANSGLFAEYATITETISPRVLDLIGHWLTQRTKTTARSAQTPDSGPTDRSAPSAK